jgi:hypothetical protein
MFILYVHRGGDPGVASVLYVTPVYVCNGRNRRMAHGIRYVRYIKEGTLGLLVYCLKSLLTHQCNGRNRRTLRPLHQGGDPGIARVLPKEPPVVVYMSYGIEYICVV